MSGVEFIGFAISLLSLLFLFFRSRRQMTSQQANGERPQDDFADDDPIQAFFREMENEKRKREAPLPPPPPKAITHPASAVGFKKPKKPFKAESDRVKSSIERSGSTFLGESRPLSPLAKRKEFDLSASFFEETSPRHARARVVIDRLADLKDMVIFREILDKPKSLRPWE